MDGSPLLSDGAASSSERGRDRGSDFQFSQYNRASGLARARTSCGMSRLTGLVVQILVPCLFAAAYIAIIARFFDPAWFAELFFAFRPRVASGKPLAPCGGLASLSGIRPVCGRLGDADGPCRGHPARRDCAEPSTYVHAGTGRFAAFCHHALRLSETPWRTRVRVGNQRARSKIEQKLATAAPPMLNTPGQASLGGFASPRLAHELHRRHNMH